MSIVRAVLKFSKLAPGWKKKEVKRVGKNTTDGIVTAFCRRKS